MDFGMFVSSQKEETVMPVDEICLDDRGFTIHLEGDSSRCIGMSWADVYQVSFYKVDAITSVIDYLIFDFEWGEFIETHNEMNGWEHLLSRLPDYVHISMPNWRNQIAKALPREESLLLFRRP
jgi:hypothetical protein